MLEQVGVAQPSTPQFNTWSKGKTKCQNKMTGGDDGGVLI